MIPDDATLCWTSGFFASVCRLPSEVAKTEAVSAVLGLQRCPPARRRARYEGGSIYSRSPQASDGDLRVLVAAGVKDRHPYIIPVIVFALAASEPTPVEAIRQAQRFWMDWRPAECP